MSVIGLDALDPSDWCFATDSKLILSRSRAFRTRLLRKAPMQFIYPTITLRIIYDYMNCQYTPYTFYHCGKYEVWLRFRLPDCLLQVCSTLLIVLTALPYDPACLQRIEG
jgi:hypothetical protein